METLALYPCGIWAQNMTKQCFCFKQLCGDPLFEILEINPLLVCTLLSAFNQEVWLTFCQFFPHGQP